MRLRSLPLERSETAHNKATAKTVTETLRRSAEPVPPPVWLRRCEKNRAQGLAHTLKRVENAHLEGLRQPKFSRLLRLRVQTVGLFPGAVHSDSVFPRDR